MDFFETAEKRFSYRESYEDKKVPREDLLKIVTAGIQAPSGCNAQTTSFVIVDDPELLTQIGIVVSNTVISTAPAVIVVIGEEKEPHPGMCFEREDYAAATENILLAVTALGYASVWLDGVLREDGRAEKIAELLHVPGTNTVRVLLPIGVPAESNPRVEKLPFEKRAWFNTFGG